MIDTRFYNELTPISVDAIVKLTGGKKHRGSGSLMVRYIAPAHKVASGGLCFVTSKSAAEQVKNEKGVICLIPADLTDVLGSDISIIVSSHPKRDLSIVINAMVVRDDGESGIHPSAVIEDDADIGEGCVIDAHAYIGHGVVLGAGCHIGTGVYIGRGCVLGDGCIIEPNVKISHAIIGKEALFGSGVVIGSTGFGVGNNGDGNVVIPHLGRVIVGDHCNFGPNTTVDRGFIDDTVIGNHVMLDNLVMIAHNVVMGDGNILCSQVGISGSTTMGDNNIFGGQAGAADHLTIGSNNVFTARAGLSKSVGDNQILSGFPAVPARDFRREVATLRRLAHSKKSPSTKDT